MVFFPSMGIIHRKADTSISETFRLSFGHLFFCSFRYFGQIMLWFLILASINGYLRSDSVSIETKPQRQLFAELVPIDNVDVRAYLNELESFYNELEDRLNSTYPGV